MGLHVDVLGPLRVRTDHEIAVDRPSHRRLLSILALNANHRVGSEVLIDRFWGETPPATAKAALQTHVAALRKLLGDESILTEGYGYRLVVDDDSLDATNFIRLADEAKQHAGNQDWTLALSPSQAALDLWRGEPYPEVVDDEFAIPQRVRLEELRLELLELRAETMLALGHHAEVLADLEALVVEHPLRERLWEHLITARYRMGRNAEALRAYQDLTSHLAEIGLEPSQPLRRLEEKILFHDKSLTQTKTNLPTELDRFIGRDRELEDVIELLDQHRLVTLVGTAGTGKTRLAINAARLIFDRFTDGVWFVELAPLIDSDSIENELARAIGLSPSGDPGDILRRALAADEALIVLDNCEHLLPGVSSFAQSILESCRDVRLLTTTREPLRVPGEAIFDVPGLTLPGPASDTSEVARFDAIALFIDRAKRARHSLHLDEQDLTQLVEICQRLDGLPLAIELAAARTASLSPEVIADRLDDRFSLLTQGSSVAPKRHRTLEATVEWSYQLLSDQERAVLMHLGVFRGGFQLDMAEHVCGRDGLGVVPIVSDLMSKSLVSQYDSPTGRRYRLLETIREFALARLEHSGDSGSAKDRHLGWAVEFASETSSSWLSGSRDGVMERVRVEADNLESALRWAEQQDHSADRGMLLEALARLWLDLGRAPEALRAVEEALDSCDDPTREVNLRTQLAHSRFWVGDLDGALREATRAYELTQKAPPSPESVFAICQLAEEYLLEVDQDPAQALDLAEEAVEMARRLDQPFPEMMARRELANALAWNGQTKDGIAQARAVLAMAREIGDRTQIFGSYQWLLHVLYMDAKARHDEPGRVVDEILAEFDVDDPQWGPRLARGWVPWALLQSGQLRLVADLLESVDSKHLQSWNLVEHRILRAAGRWMLGDLEEARDDLLDAEKEGINPRWYHDYYPLLVDVLSDLEAIDEAREAADTYLKAELHPTEEIKKVGALNPLIRAEIDRGVADPDEREEREARVHSFIESMERIITEFPQPIEGSISMETPSTHLAIARAELSRITGPEPELWRDAHERADYLYFRLYTQLRLGESLLHAGRGDEGKRELVQARARAEEIGAAHLFARTGQVADESGITLR